MKNSIKSLLASVMIIALMSSCESYDFNEAGLLVPLTVDEDPSLPSISVNNTMLHSETFGDPADPMIVVLHGGPGADYRSVLNCQHFANDGYYVIFYDQRGCGLSQRHQADVYSIQSYIDDLEAVIDYYLQSVDQKVILMGHSWGAMLATVYVNVFPDRVDGLVLMEPGGLTWDVTLEYINRSRVLNLFEETTNDYVYVDQFITSDQHIVLDYKSDLGMAPVFAEGNITGDQGPYPYWRFGAVCANATIDYAFKNSFDFTTNLGEYETEVLFVYSELNAAYGKEHAEFVSSVFPKVQLKKIDGSGHEIPYFGWENFYPEALDYMNDLSK